MSLEKLRSSLTEVDNQLLEVIARRQEIVSDIGKAKQDSGRGTRDFAREKVVIETARSRAAEVGVPADLAEDLMTMLIRSSLTQQERDMVMAHGAGQGRRALIIGGLGKIGGWFVRFLDSQGYAVEIADSQAQNDSQFCFRDWQQSDMQQDVIVVATPLGVSATVLESLADRAPPGLIFDVASLKGPIKKGLCALHKRGCRVTSVHPMFGPDTRLLSGKHIIFSDVGNREATEAAKALFAPTMAVLVEMSMENHDRKIAYVLGLSHALNIAFFSALLESGEDADALAQLSSTTFDNQLDVSKRVSGDNPRLYFEIQSLNEFQNQPLLALSGAVEKIRKLVHDKDEAGFVTLMEAGRSYLSNRVMP